MRLIYYCLYAGESCPYQLLIGHVALYLPSGAPVDDWKNNTNTDFVRATLSSHSP